jgi:hypothetical protein
LFAAGIGRAGTAAAAGVSIPGSGSLLRPQSIGLASYFEAGTGLAACALAISASNFLTFSGCFNPW